MLTLFLVHENALAKVRITYRSYEKNRSNEGPNVSSFKPAAKLKCPK
jgi:hypothetical protein